MLFFFSPQLTLQFTEGVLWLSNGFNVVKTILSHGSRGGSNFFQGGGGSTFSRGGVQMLISIETHITCDFPAGGLDRLSPPPPPPPPPPTLDPHML